MIKPKGGACRDRWLRRCGVLLALGLCLAGSAAPALAAPLREAGPRPLTLLAERRPAIGRDQAAAVARKVTGGRVLAVSTTSSKGVTVYQVRVLLPDGRVRVVLVDAKSGRVIN